jgi:hypothetical protein
MELQSEGHCIFCDDYFSQKDLNRHLTTHLKRKAKEDKDQITTSYHHIVVEAGVQFLHLLVKSSCEMAAIDDFLRAIWLDCCGHQSGFHVKKGPEIEMEERVENVLTPKTKIHHDYDYGTTTRTFLKSQNQYDLDFDDEDIILLSRNEPLKIMCTVCSKKPAKVACTSCMWEQDAYYCTTCAKKHDAICEDFEDYARVRIVNSPRMGECGYEGGSYDLARDGSYKERKNKV